MLPIYDKPTLQYLIEEAITSGIDDILIITGKTKDPSKTISTNHMNSNTHFKGQAKTVTLKKSEKSQIRDICY